MPMVFFSSKNDKYQKPETRVLANLKSESVLNNFFKDKNNKLYFTTSLNSQKAEQIKLNKNTSVYLYEDMSMEALTLFGSSKIIDDENLKNEIWQDDWIQHYPKGKNDKNYAIIEFTIEAYKFYDNNYILHEGKL